MDLFTLIDKIKKNNKKTNNKKEMNNSKSKKKIRIKENDKEI